MTTLATSWRESGACLSADPELFFPLTARGPGAGQISNALHVCARCEVRQQCLDFAMQMNEAEGIWGGTTPEERVTARRRSQRQAAARARTAVRESRAS